MYEPIIGYISYQSWHNNTAVIMMGKLITERNVCHPFCFQKCFLVYRTVIKIHVFHLPFIEAKQKSSFQKWKLRCSFRTEEAQLWTRTMRRISLKQLQLMSVFTKRLSASHTRWGRIYCTLVLTLDFWHALQRGFAHWLTHAVLACADSSQRLGWGRARQEGAAGREVQRACCSVRRGLCHP